MAGNQNSGNRTPRRGSRLLRNIQLSREAASALRVLTAADITTSDPGEVVNRLVLAAWRNMDAEISKWEEDAIVWEGEIL